MNTTGKFLIAAGAAAVLGGVAIATASWADRGFDGHHGMRMGFMRGMMAEQLLRDVDTDRDGKLTQQEIDAAVSTRFERFDADKNGRLSLEEFQVLWADLTRPVTVRAFQFLDPDGDAAVTRAELENRFSRVVQRFDRNSDGALSPDDRPRWGGPGPGERR